MAGAALDTALSLVANPWRVRTDEAGRLADTVQRELLHHETPYGTALRHIDVENRDGTHLRVQYCCPRAFLWLCCLVSVAFKTFLADHLPDGRSRVCLYCDDVRPGNVHRPEPARLYYAFYYTLLELPEFLGVPNSVGGTLRLY